MAAINAGTRRQRGLFGLLCGTISIKKSVMCIGDSSVAENDVAERSPSWTQPDAEVPPAVPVAPPVTIPSPVLVSKKLAEEAVAKRRNVRFRHHATVIEEEEENDIESAPMTGANEKLLLENNKVSVVESKPINRRPRQKKMAPAPPLPGIIANAS